MGKFFSIFHKKHQNKTTDELKTLLQKNYSYFQSLLNINNEVLTLMADLGEKLSGEYVFDMEYIRANINKTSEGVLKIINYLNLLSENKYSQLLKVYEDIKRKIDKTIHARFEIPATDFTLPIEALSKDSVIVAGGKIANLAEIRNVLKIPTPEGFAISSYSFIKFIEHNNLKEKISEILEKIDINNLEEIENGSRKIREIIISSEVPQEIIDSINYAYKKLQNKINKNFNVAIRSSAIHEDSYYSFAGQYSSFLNIPENLIIQKYKEVLASLFSPNAVFYYKTKGFTETEMIMAVGVLPMINARAGGVMYTKDPNNPESDNIIINSAKGLGKLVVDGSITPDMFSIKKDNLSILEKKLGKQDKILSFKDEGDIEEIPFFQDKNSFSLTDEQIISLSKIGLEIEKYYNHPQDIEWAVDENNKIYILQTRPLRIAEYKSEPKVLLPTRISGHNIILEKGFAACKGIGYGKAFVLKEEQELENFPEGYILVAKHTNPKYVIIMNKASAILTDIGSITGHMASLAREYNVPTILNTEIGTKKIRHEQEITVDATNCVVYEGKVEELINIAKKNDEKFKETLLYKTLKNVSQLVIPLNLVDPTSENFSIENCKTFHDITRFCHEMVMHEMFTMWNKYETEIRAIPLTVNIPISILVLDIDGGLKEGLKKVTTEDILSIPFKSVLKGMTTMKWPEPPSVNGKGFIGIIARTAQISENELMEIGKKSFCIITKNYMNFSIRLGYHFSMIEAYAGENINDNYIKFFFKGGGAALDRRLRRITLLTKILKKMNFRVSTKEDVLHAILTKFDTPTIEKYLEIFGKLTAYTKQLDMALFNDAITQMYIDEFIKKYIKEE